MYKVTPVQSVTGGDGFEIRPGDFITHNGIGAYPVVGVYCVGEMESIVFIDSFNKAHSILSRFVTRVTERDGEYDD
jgi:hypothetical protein